MEVINYDNIDFSRLDKYTPLGLSSNNFYLNEREEIFKIFRDYELKKINNKEKIIDEYDKLNKDYILNVSKIKKDDILVGYKSKFIEGYTLDELIRMKGIMNTLKIIINISKKLEDLHSIDNNPIIGDINFGNIIIKKDDTPIFIDIDGYGISDISPEYISFELYKYYKSRDYKLEFNPLMDKISLWINLFNRIFSKDIETRGLAYEDYEYQYPFLKDLKEIYIDLIKNHKSVPNVPYLHYVLKE